MFFKVSPRVEKTEVFRKDWNFANWIYFASCIMKKHCFLLWTKNLAFFPYFYHQKQPFRGFVALQLYWNGTSTWVLSCKFAVYFQNTFSKKHPWMANSVLWNKFLQRWAIWLRSQVYILLEHLYIFKHKHKSWRYNSKQE